MGPTLSNLKNLLRMPYGCGEQNMASWSPNIYVLQYLTNTNQLTEKIEEEAKGYMRVGEWSPMNFFFVCHFENGCLYENYYSKNLCSKHALV